MVEVNFEKEEKLENIEWINDFKVAVVEENFKKIEELSNLLPKFIIYTNMIQAQYLIKEALVLLYKEKQQTAIQMQKLKLNRQFLSSSYTGSRNAFDKTS
jgi:hypothetical protein